MDRKEKVRRILTRTRVKPEPSFIIQPDGRYKMIGGGTITAEQYDKGNYHGLVFETVKQTEN